MRAFGLGINEHKTRNTFGVYAETSFEGEKIKKKKLKKGTKKQTKNNSHGMT